MTGPPGTMRRTEAFAYLWYLAFLLLEPTLGEHSVETWLVIAISVALFLPLYLAALRVSGRRAIVLIWGIAALGLVTMPFNAGGGTYLVFAVALITRRVPARLAVAHAGVWIAATLVEAAVFGLPVWTWAVAVIGVTAIGAATMHAVEAEGHHVRLLRAQEEVEQMAAVAERERIARDLHDVLGHTLSVIALKSELASRVAESDPQRAAREIRDVERVARAALTDVRSAVEGYRHRGLAAEVASARDALATAGIQFEAEMPASRLPPRQETAFALALREAATNVLRHSGATVCRARLNIDGPALRLTVQDDGCGGAASEGHGLAGIRERAAQLGGRVEVDRRAGLRLEVTLPLGEDAAVP